MAVNDKITMDKKTIRHLYNRAMGGEEEEEEPRKPSPYRDFECSEGSGSLEKKIVLNVKDIIGNEGSRMLYQNNDFFVRWNYAKRSGEHKKDSGSIAYRSLVKDNKVNPEMLLAYLDVYRGSTRNLVVIRRNFERIIENHPDAPFYNEITKLFYRPDSKKVSLTFLE